MLQSWFGYPAEPNKFAQLQLPETSPRVLFTVISGLYQALRYLDKRTSVFEASESLEALIDSEEISSESAAKRLAYLTTSFNAITRWPAGFLGFLNEYRLQDGYQSTGNINDDFPYLYNILLEGRWRYPEIDFLQRVFEDFLVEHYQRVQNIEKIRRYQEDELFQSRFIDVSLSQAARMLNVTNSEIYELITQGQLWRRINSNYELTSPPWVPRDEVLLILDEWKNEFTVDSAAERLRTTKEVVLRLIELNLIEAPFIEESSGIDSCVISGRAMHRFINSLHRSLGNTTGPLYTLRQASICLSCCNYDEAKVIEAVIRKELRAQNGVFLDRLQIQVSDVEALRRRFIHQLVLENFGRVAKKRGVYPTVLRVWVQAGLIQVEHVADQDFFIITDEEWERFDRTYMSRSQAAEFHGIPLSTLESWENRGLIQEVGWKEYRVHTNLFRREDIENFSPKKIYRKNVIRKENSMGANNLNE